MCTLMFVPMSCVKAEPSCGDDLKGGVALQTASLGTHLLLGKPGELPGRRGGRAGTLQLMSSMLLTMLRSQMPVAATGS